MRTIDAIACVALAAAASAAAAPPPREEAFDACMLFTQADAEKALGTAAAAEPVNPKIRRPKVVTGCTYTGEKEGQHVAASAEFRVARTDAEARGAFEEARLRDQTKPLLLDGMEAFWSARTGQMNFRKGRTWVTVSVGPQKVDQRDLEQAKRLAAILATKI